MVAIPSVDYEIPMIYQDRFHVVRADAQGLRDRVYRIRYQVYCVENPFEDPAENPDGREIDAEDERAAHILLVHRESGADAGTARVIFPDTEREQPLPIQRVLDPAGRRFFRRLPWRTTGEVSRFAVPKTFRRRLGEERHADIGWHPDAVQSWPADRRLMPFITFGLLCGVLDICLEHRLTHIAAIMEPPLIRLMRRFGLDFQFLGGPVAYHGFRQPCVARLDDLIDHARSEGNLLWQYAGAEVFHHRPLISVR